MSRRPASGIVSYWVSSRALARLTAMGATIYQPLVEREAGFVTAAALDPFGHVLVLYSPHYLEVFDITRSR